MRISRACKCATECSYIHNKENKFNTMPQDISVLKQKVVIGFLVFLAVVIFYSLFWGPARKFSDSFAPVRTVTVAAEGKVTVEPDVARLSFSVVSEGKSPEALADDNNKKMNGAIDFIKSQGVDAKDIKTTQYSLSPRYDYGYEPCPLRDSACLSKPRIPLIVGYTLTQEVSVKVRDLKKVASILGGLPERGINQIGAISFDVDDPEKSLFEAREKAFQKAHEKAGVMARNNGVRLGSVLTFTENTGGPIYYPMYERALDKGVGTASVAPSIEPGSREITVTVNVTYALR